MRNNHCRGGRDIHKCSFLLPAASAQQTTKEGANRPNTNWQDGMGAGRLLTGVMSRRGLGTCLPARCYRRFPPPKLPIISFSGRLHDAVLQAAKWALKNVVVVGAKQKKKKLKSA